MYVETTVLNGFPVTIEFNTLRAEPEVGIMGEGVEDWSIVELNGKPCKTYPNWLHNRIVETEGEEELLIVACLESF